jgi:hypothetical protein
MVKNPDANQIVDMVKTFSAMKTKIDDAIWSVMKSDAEKFEKQYGKYQEVVDPEERMKLQAKFMDEVIDPHVFAAVSAIIGILVQISFPKDILMQEIGALYDEHTIAVNAIRSFITGEPLQKDLVITPVKIAPPPKDKSKLN